MLEIKTKIQDKDIIIQLEEGYSYGEGYKRNIISGLEIGQTYGKLRSKKYGTQTGFWRILHEKKQVIVKYKDEFGLNIEMKEKIKPKEGGNWINKYFNF